MVMKNTTSVRRSLAGMDMKQFYTRCDAEEMLRDCQVIVNGCYLFVNVEKLLFDEFKVDARRLTHTA